MRAQMTTQSDDVQRPSAEELPAEELSAEPLSTEELATLTQVTHQVARRARLSPDDALDFGQTVHLKLLERRYQPVRQFSGRSSLRTFLTVVVQRMLLDWRRSQFGKWRSSSAARRLGPQAVALERLVYRSDHTLSEAIQILQARPGGASASELAHLAGQLPVRCAFRPVSIETVEDAGAVDFSDPIEAADNRRAAIALRHRLSSALQALPEAERTLLDLRYRQMLRVPAIAYALNADSKALYRRCDKALSALRATLQAE